MECVLLLGLTVFACYGDEKGYRPILIIFVLIAIMLPPPSSRKSHDNMLRLDHDELSVE
jgi:hypothetical protein